MAFSFISDLWNKWNIRGFVLLSLSLQVSLILFAPLRKKTADHCILFLLWLAYLMADSVATFAVGFISHNQGNSKAHVLEVDGALQAFWASFLLLHLGGPDTITAFSLEDSSLWQRHLLSLIFQVSAAIYVFLRIFPSDKSLVIPTILVFLAGVIKIAERTLALYLSSLPKLRESLLLDDKPRMAAESQLREGLNVLGDGQGRLDEEKAKLDESIVVKHAYSFFQIFKVLIADLIFTKQQRITSREYFAKVSAVDALRVISVELNFIYDELHTKALTIHHKWSYIVRIVAFTGIAVALGLFNRLKKHGLPELDVKITHVLLFGAIVLDGIALFMLIFSDWTVARIKPNTTGSSKLDSFLYKLVSAADYLSKPRYAACKVEPNTNDTYEVFDTPLILRRWSESIAACNLFSEAMKESPRKICKGNQFWGMVVFKDICSFPFRMVDKIISCSNQAGETIARCCGKRSMIGNAKYVSKNLFVKKLWIYIFNVVKRDSSNADDPDRVRWMIKASGNLFMPSLPRGSDRDERGEYFTKANIHAQIISFHISTEIWYNKEKPTERNDEREFCKILSDYMLYLLLNQPEVVSDVAMVGVAQMRWMQTLLDISSVATEDLEGTSQKLYDEGPPRARAVSDGTNPSKSLLNKGLGVARRIGQAEAEKWEVMSRAWVEVLCYAAINIKGEAHVQVLSKGGELLAFVWLLMAHFGCLYKREWGMYHEFWEEWGQNMASSNQQST